MGSNVPKIQANQGQSNGANQQNQSVYKVKSGDTVYSLAKKYGISVQEFKELTGIKSDNLTSGQVINLTRLENAGKKEKTEENETHKVKKGETLYSIAQKYGVTVDELKKANNLKNDSLQLNAEIKIPKSKNTATVEKEKPVETLQAKPELKPEPKIETPKVIEEEVVVKKEEKSAFKRFWDWVWSEDEEAEPKKLDKEIKQTSPSITQGSFTVLQSNKTKVNLTNGKTFTSGQLYKDSFTAGQKDYTEKYKKEIAEAKIKGKTVDLAFSRPEPLLNKDGQITALVETYNSTNNSKNAPLKGKTIIVNAGHGGYNPKTGVFDAGTHALDANYKLQEEWVKNKRFTDSIIPELTSQGAKVFFIQGSAASVMEAKEKYANADLFISIHCDSATENKDKRGQTILFRGDDTKGKRLAESVEKRVETHEWLSIDLCNSKKDNRGLGILNKDTKIPSILIETGFQSNTKDLANIDSRKFHAEFAELLGQGIQQYFNPEKKFSSYNQFNASKIPVAIKPEGNSSNDITKAAMAGAQAGAVGGTITTQNNTQVSSAIPKSQADETVEKLMPYIRNTAKETGFSESFLKQIVKFELGNNTDFRRIYDDTVGTKTIGIGHALTNDDIKNQKFTKTLTDEQMFELFKKDLKSAENDLIRNIGKDNYAKLNFRQKEALVDFVFNRGITNFLSSTSIKTELKKNNPSHDAIASQLTYSVAQKNKQFKCGLAKRRLWEMQRYCGDNLKNSPKTLKAAQELYNTGFDSGKNAEKLTISQLNGYNQEISSMFGNLIKYKSP